MTTMTAPRGKAVLGPRSLNPFKCTLAFQRNPLQFLGELQKQYGDITQFRLAIWPTVVVNHPDYIKHILQDNHSNYNKDVLMFQIARPLIGTDSYPHLSDRISISEIGLVSSSNSDFSLFHLAKKYRYYR